LSSLIVKEKKRPTIPIYDDKITLYLFNIMKECWNHNILNRPTINDIFISMTSKLNDIKYFSNLTFSDYEKFDTFFKRDSNSYSYINEKIWKLEEVSDSPITIQNINLGMDDESNNHDYNLIELDDFEINESLIKFKE
jgi:hypothetical protein